MAGIDGGRAARLSGWVRERGLRWTLLRSTYVLSVRVGEAAKRSAIDIERDKLITGEGALSSLTNTVAENRTLWGEWDWSRGGEEWTDHAAQTGLDPDAWKARLIAEAIDPLVGPGDVVLEIGPGAGRWSRELADRCGTLHLSDINQVCLDLCRDVLGDDGTVRYHLSDGSGRLDLPDSSVDAVWSYDVFVHINPTDTAAYLSELSRVLRPGGRGAIHHSGHLHRTSSFRSQMDASMFRGLAERYGLVVDRQDEELTHKREDTITFFHRP